MKEHLYLKFLSNSLVLRISKIWFGFYKSLMILVGSLCIFYGHIFIVVQGQFRELVQLAEKYQKPRISTKLIKDLLAASNNDAAQKCLKLVEKEKGAGN